MNDGICIKMLSDRIGTVNKIHVRIDPSKQQCRWKRLSDEQMSFYRLSTRSSKQGFAVSIQTSL